MGLPSLIIPHAEWSSLRSSCGPSRSLLGPLGLERIGQGRSGPSSPTLFQCFPDCDGQGPHRERLLYEVHTFFEHPMVGNHIGRVAGHEQALEIRAKGLQPRDQFTTVHLWHDHVGQEQVDFAFVLCCHAHRVGRAGSDQNSVPPIFPKLPHRPG